MNIDLLRFEVLDTGVGMGPEDLQKLFKPFEQVGDVQSRAAGTGLGLAISRRIVQLMGSDIEVKSKPGEGSAFWFEVELPGARVELHETQRRVQEIVGYKGRRRKVLAADDKLSNRLVMASLLEPLGFQVVLAEDGRELVEKAKAERPDLVITDLVMPELTGFEAAQQIRQALEIKDTVILAVSASAFEADRQRSKVAGCDDFLSKPVVAVELLDMMATHLDLEWTYQEGEIGPAIPLIELDESTLVPPPPEKLNALYEIALRGDMEDIADYAAHIETLGDAYLPFARKLKELANNFLDEQILAMVAKFRTKLQG